LATNGVITALKRYDEKGKRFESATVPAAVMPHHQPRDDGFKNYLPLFRSERNGKAF